MANKKFLVPLGLVSLDSDPASGTEGDLYFNNVSDNVKLYKNGAWTDLVSAGNLPSGGTTGQILAKSSNTNYAVEWIENYADYTETVKLKVKNDGTRALYKGEPVYVTGSDGTNVLVGRSTNATEGGSSKTIGLLAQNLATNGQGFVIKEGKLGTLDTSTAGAVGDPVWLGVDGALIYGLSNKPHGATHLVYLGVVTKKNGSTGEIFVQVQNGFEIRELHDVGIGYDETITDNEVLAYDTTSGTWINQTAVEAGLVDLNSTQTLENKTLIGSSYGSNKVDVNSYNLTLESGLYGVAIRTSTDRFDTVSHEWDFGTDGWLTTPGNILLNGDLVFEGSSVDAYETTLTVINPTSDRTVSLPDATGTVALTSDLNKITAKNISETTISAFTPVFINNETLGLSQLTFSKADSSVSSKMPATGITTESVADGSFSKIVMQGVVTGITLTGYVDGDVLYVASGGGLTKTRPTGSNLIQPFGRVISVDNGSIYVYGNTFASSIDTLPNLTSDKIWLGTSGRPVETTLNTANVPENTNLYFTDERAQDAAASMITGGTHSGVSVEYVDSTNKFNFTNTGVTALYGTTNEISVSGSTGDITIGIPDSPVFVTPNIGVASATSINGTSIPSSKTLLVTTDIGSSVQAYDADLSSIADLTGTSGFLKKTSANTWTLDTATYATAGDISSAVGDYIPLSQKGDFSGVAELDIDGKVPVAQIPDLSGTYSVSTHNHTLDSLSNVVITGTPVDGEAIVWDSTTSKWVNEVVSGGSGNVVTVSDTAPTSPNTGDGWYKNTDATYHVYDGTYWVEVTSVVTMSQEEAQDLVAPLLDHSTHSGLSASYDDAENKIILTVNETDPIFTASEAFNITSTDTSNWDTAYGWGDHSVAGYLTSYDAGNTYAALSGANFTGNIAINNGSYSEITTTSTTAEIFNTTATTVKIGEAATTISIGDINHTGTTTINNDLSVYGNITFGGGASQLSATVIQIDDTLISLADNNTDDILDIGFYAGYEASSTAFHTGLVRDASDSGKWKLFSNVDAQPTDIVDFSNAIYDTLKIGILEVTDASTTRTNLGLGTMAVATASDYLTTSTASTTYLQQSIAAGTYAPLASPTFTGTVSGVTKSMVGLGSVENTALSTWAGSTNITTIGTITSGTWSGTTIGISKGGTGLTSLGTAGQVLTVNAGATAAEWKDATGGGGTVVQETPPISPATGDTWFKNSESILYIYDGSFWIEVNSLLTIPLEDIVELDNISKQFDGAETRFLPTFNGNMIPITNPYRLLLIINGIIQEMGFPEYVWQSDLPRSGYRIDNDGYIAFSEAPPIGSTFNARIMAGPTTNTTKKVYAFEATDILLGA